MGRWFRTFVARLSGVRIRGIKTGSGKWDALRLFVPAQPA